MLLLLLIQSLQNPQHWQLYPSIEHIQSVTFSNSDLYIGVPAGIYILDRSSFRLRRTLTALDGLEGDIRLCAFLPGRNLLYISTRGHLYEYLPATDVLRELSPPFSEIRSIGIAPEVAWFETDRGIFRRVRSAPQFEPASPPATGINWYGERDTTTPWAYPALTPYYVVDHQLERHQLTRVWPEPRGRRLYAATQEYGLIVFNQHTGFSDRRLAPGPSSNRIRRAFLLDGRLWFLGNDRVETIDSLGNWGYTKVGIGRLIPAGSSRVLTAFSGLRSPEQLTVLLPDSAGLLLGTSEGLYRLDATGTQLPLTDILRSEPGAAISGINAAWYRRDSLFVGTDDGLFLLTPDTLSSITDPFGRFDWGVFDILQTPDGDAFFGTLGGIVRLTPTNTWTQLIPPGYSLNLPVRRLAAGGDYLFFSYGSSIGAYNRRLGSWHMLPAATPLPWPDIQLLHADSGSVWFAAPGIVGRCRFRSMLP